MELSKQLLKVSQDASAMYLQDMMALQKTQDFLASAQQSLDKKQAEKEKIAAEKARADAEAALRAWAQRFRAHFLATEALAASEGVDLRDAKPGVARELWGRAG